MNIDVKIVINNLPEHYRGKIKSTFKLHNETLKYLLIHSNIKWFGLNSKENPFNLEEGDEDEHIFIIKDKWYSGINVLMVEVKVQ